MSLDFIAIDFETANRNRASACAVGLVKIVDGQIVDEFYSLINPEVDFDSFNIAIHGITPSMVTDAPIYPQILKMIDNFCENLPIVAHYAPFDIGVLRDSNERYNIDEFEAKYFDSYFLAQKYMKTISYKLKHLCELIGFDFEHHNAQEDARACANLVLYLCNENSFMSIDELVEIAGYKKYGQINGYEGSGFRINKNSSNSLSSKDIESMIQNIDRNSLDNAHPFFDKHGCFTGKLESMKRTDAMVQFAQLGGIPEKGVTKKTNFLVMGEQDIRVVGEGLKSSKIKKAEKLLNEGQEIQLLGEVDFLRML